MRAEIWIAGALACASLFCAPPIATSSVSAEPTLTIHAHASPDKLGASTNLSATATFGSSGLGVQSPVLKTTFFGPKGMSIDVRGAGTCTANPTRLQEAGPRACPTSSRIGFGAGVGLVEIAKEVVKGHFTLEFFLAPSVRGLPAMLVYVNFTTPTSWQQVLLAYAVKGSSPYGIGIALDVPSLSLLPGGLLGWEESVSVTLGSASVAYYRTVHGKKRLVHVRGIVLPRRCPPGGFPIAADVEFADGSTATSRSTIPCPRG
jgi:hypothetical protein